MKKIFSKLLLLIFSVFGVWFVASELQPNVKVSLDGNVFDIPKDNMLGIPFFILYGYDGPYEPGNEYNLYIQAQEVQKAIPEFKITDGVSREDLNILISSNAAICVDYYFSPEFHLYKNAWYGLGNYDSNNATIDPISGYYRVEDKLFPLIWIAMKIKPDPKKPIPQDITTAYLGSCLDIGLEANGKTRQFGNSASCRILIRYKNLFVDYHIGLMNLKLYPQVSKLILQKMEKWASDAEKKGYKYKPPTKPKRNACDNL